jgi:hypothetical protein
MSRESVEVVVEIAEKEEVKRGGESMMERKEEVRERGSKTKGGGESMKKLLLAVLMMLIGGIALGGQTDTVVLTVNPVFSLSVNISSATNSFGTGDGYANDVVLGTSRTICVGEIENDGNVSAKWQTMIVKSSNYTDLTEGGTESPKHPKTEKRSLWATILMPTNITTDGTQSITLSVRAIVQ